MQGLQDGQDVAALLSAVTGMSAAESSGRVLQRLLHRLLLALHEAETGSERCAQLLEAAFSFISVEELRVVPLSLLQQLPAIPPRFLLTLSSQSRLLRQLPLPLCRQVWLSAPHAAADSLSAAIQAFIQQQHSGDGDPSSASLSAIVADSPALFVQAAAAVVPAFASSGHRCLAQLLLSLTLQHQHSSSPSTDSREPQPLRPAERAAYELLLRWSELWQRSIAAAAITPETRAELAAVLSRYEQLTAGGLSQALCLCFWLLLCHPSVSALLQSGIVCCLREVVQREIVPSEHEALPLYSELLQAAVQAQQRAGSGDCSRARPPQLLFQLLFPLLAELVLLSIVREKEDIDPRLSARHSHAVGSAAQPSELTAAAPSLPLSVWMRAAVQAVRAGRRAEPRAAVVLLPGSRAGARRGPRAGAGSRHRAGGGGAGGG